MELIIIAAAAGALYWFSRPKAPPPTTDVTTPAPAPATGLSLPTGRAFSGAGSLVSGGYQIAGANVGWAGAPPLSPTVGSRLDPMLSRYYKSADPSADIINALATSAATLASTISSPPIPAPPPVQRGGIAGTVGTGGIPLGSNLRTGLTSGTGTTVVGTTRSQLLPLTKILF